MGRRSSMALGVLAAAALIVGVTGCQPKTAPVQGTPPPAATGTSPAATSPPAASPPVEVRIDKMEYRSGERVALTIVNRGDGQYAFNPCNRTIEQESGGKWAPFEEPGRICTMEVWLIDPGETRTAETTLPRTMGPGRYRLSIAMGRQTPPAADRPPATSGPFSVVS
jgi:hypothetical protein